MPIEEWERRLAKRKGTVCLPYNVQVIIPHTCKPDCPEAYENLREDMTKLFGGTTVYTAEGFWIDPHGKLVPDKVKVIESAHSCMDEKQEKEFIRAVMRAADKARQEAISIKAGRFLIVPTKKR